MLQFDSVRRLSINEYQWLATNGIFDECPHVEMLDGYVIKKKMTTPLHDDSVEVITGLLRSVSNRDWYIRPQKLLVTKESCPEPDVAVIRGRPLDYQLHHPQATDCVLAVEIADQDVSRDRRKAAIYARAGVPEYWLVNLVDWQLERMTQPLPDGRYQQTEIFTVKDAVPLIIAGAEVARISLQELLTPPES